MLLKWGPHLTAKLQTVLKLVLHVKLPKNLPRTLLQTLDIIHVSQTVREVSPAFEQIETLTTSSILLVESFRILDLKIY